MNMWVNTAFFFIAFSPLVYWGFEFYAKILKVIGNLNYFYKYVIAFMTFILFSGFIISPIIVAPMLFPSWRAGLMNEASYLTYFLIFYVASVIPGWYQFNKNHIAQLRILGFLKSVDDWGN